MERRLIDAKEAYELACEGGYYGDFALSLADLTSLKNLLDDCTTIDVVEVVRCRECKYCLVQIPLPDGYLYCQELNRAVSDNDYCSRGVRREPDANNLHD